MYLQVKLRNRAAGATLQGKRVDFELTDEQRALSEAARAYATSLSQQAREIERSNEPPGRDLKLALGAQGSLGVNLAPEYSGLGLGSLEALLILEEFAKIHPAIAFPVFESSVGPVKAIELSATEGNPVSARRAARWISSRIASIRIAISAIFSWTA